MQEKTILIIKSISRNEKYIYIAKNTQKNVVLEYKVKEDIIAELKEFLQKNGYKLTDFNDFIALKTNSFTGYREAVTICNLLKRYIKNTPVNELEFPQYHQEPNITQPK